MSEFSRTIRNICCFFTLAVIIYIGALAIGVDAKAGGDGVYVLLLKNVAVLFGYSCIFGLSGKVLRSKISSAARRVVHVVIMYAATVAASLLLANPGKDARQIIMFIFIATLLYAVVYVASLLVLKFIEKIK